MPSPYLTDHYLTLLECCFALKAGKPLSEIDEGVSKKQSMCQFGCKYVFLSKRDEDRHNHLVHPAELRTKQRQAQQQKRQSAGSEQQGAKKSCHRCTFEGCGALFTSYHQLVQHKRRDGHNLPRGRPSKK